jgi:molybdenum cofactor guanylyltransferase
MCTGHPATTVEAAVSELPTYEEITGVILAGGRGARMGGQDKGLISLNGRPMVQHVIDRLRSQVGTLIINANRNHVLYRAYGYRVVSDQSGHYAGPLAGILSVLHAVECGWIVTAPCDVPLLSDTLVAKLIAAVKTEGTDIATAHDGERMQHGFLLLRTSLRPDVEAFLNGGERAVKRWLTRHRVAVANFSDCAEAFTNVNDSLQRQLAEMRLREIEHRC